jgi:DNA-binding transcriptional LysR family regulator
MEWDKLKVFYTVAKEGSLSKAAQRMNIAQSAVTRTIAILEHSLKTSLFIRSSRGVVLTRQGERVFKEAQEMAIRAENIRAIVEEGQTEVKGEIKVTSGFGFSSTSLGQHIMDFMETYPEVYIDLICNDEDLDLKTREADISIKPFDPKGGDSLIQTFLLTRVQHLYASPNYIRKKGMPKNIEDLEYHSFISFNNPHRPLPYGPHEWILRAGLPDHKPSRNPIMTVNSVECLYQAAIKGLGIIALSKDSMLLERTELIQILPDLQSPKIEMHFIYPKSLKSIKLIKVLEKFLVQRYKNYG